MSRYNELMDFTFPEVVHSYTARDTILYALGVGAGTPATDPHELRHVYEDGLAALPSMAVTLAYPGNWYRDLSPGIDHVRVVHGSERFELHNPIPVAATLSARPRIVAIHDKGEGRGALVVSQRLISDHASGQPIATVTQTAFCRGDGGLGGPIVPPPVPHALPSRAPDVDVEVPTSPRAALIYRLMGDDNPLHVDPAFAEEAGFPAPILHGLATYGHVCRAVLRAFAKDGELTVTAMDCRFTAPVFPGETLSVRLWREGNRVSFATAVGGRTVIDNGIAELGATGRGS